MRILWSMSTLLLTISAMLIYLSQLLKRSSRLKMTIIYLLLLCAGITFVITLLSPVLLPSTVTFKPSSFISQVGIMGDSRLAKGVSEHGTVILGPYWTLLPGSYKFTLNYQLSDTAASAALVRVIAISKPPNSGLINLINTQLLNNYKSSVISFEVPSKYQVVIDVYWNGSGTLLLNGISLSKTSSD